MLKLLVTVAWQNIYTVNQTVHGPLPLFFFTCVSHFLRNDQNFDANIQVDRWRISRFAHGPSADMLGSHLGGSFSSAVAAEAAFTQALIFLLNIWMMKRLHCNPQTISNLWMIHLQSRLLVKHCNFFFYLVPAIEPIVLFIPMIRVPVTFHKCKCFSNHFPITTFTMLVWKHVGLVYLVRLELVVPDRPDARLEFDARMPHPRPHLLCSNGSSKRWRVRMWGITHVGILQPTPKLYWKSFRKFWKPPCLGGTPYMDISISDGNMPMVL